jgi:hypothetical protein
MVKHFAHTDNGREYTGNGMFLEWAPKVAN